jgi:ketosteroid isomerase-like protein
MNTQSLNQTDALALATELARVKSEQNVAAALDIYHPEVELISPSFNAQAKGRKEVEQQLQLFFGLFPDYSVSLEQHAVNGNVLLATGQVSVTLNAQDQVCPRIQVPVFIEFHIRDERIAKEVFYLDAGLVCKKSGVSAEELKQATQALLP